MAIDGGVFNVRFGDISGILSVRGVRLVYESHARGKGGLGDSGTVGRVGVQAPGEAENAGEKDKGSKGDLGKSVSSEFGT